jgi:hypothetical protein
VLPSNCSKSVGNNDTAKLLYLLDCGNGPDEDTGPTDCDWWTRPPRPGTKKAASSLAPLEDSAAVDALEERVADLTR